MSRLPIKKATESAQNEQFVVVAGPEAEEKLQEFAAYLDVNCRTPETSSVLIRNMLNSMYRRTKEGRIAQAYAWAKSDDFLQSLIKLKTDFALAGCSFHATNEDGINLEDQLKVSSGKSYVVQPTDVTLSDTEKQSLLEQKETQRFVSRLARKWDLTPIVRSLIEDWNTCDSMILYWKMDTTPAGETQIEGAEAPEKNQLLPGVLQIAALNPSNCRYDNTAGNDRLMYELPLTLRLRIQHIVFHNDKRVQQIGIQLLLEEGVPQEWIDAVSKGKSEVELRREHGDRWLVQTKARLHEGLADPSMQSIYPFLEERKMLKEGEFSAAFMMKHFILHVKMGESIETGPKTGSRENWATPKETAAMGAVLSRTAMTARVVTNHTVSFNFIFPPGDIWDGKKYVTPEAAIARWNGVVKVVSEGDGATGSSGHIGVKQLIADILYARGRVQHIFAEFFDDPTIQGAMAQKPKEGTVIQPKFDENVLKDAGQLLKEIQFLFSQHILDPQSAARELGRDPDLIYRRKLEAAISNQATGVSRPLHEMQFGGGGGFQDQGGRPPNEGTVTDGDTSRQVPITK